MSDKRFSELNRPVDCEPRANIPKQLATRIAFEVPGFSEEQIRAVLGAVNQNPWRGEAARRWRCSEYVYPAPTYVGRKESPTLVFERRGDGLPWTESYREMKFEDLDSQMRELKNFDFTPKTKAPV